MTDHFKIDINGSVLLLFILGILVIFFIVWMYRSTIPPSGRRKRIVLAVIRSSVFTLILFFIFEPVLIRFYQEKELPVISVLVDQSRSMSIKDSAGPRSERVIRYLNDPVWKEIAEKQDVRFFLFSDSLKEKNIPTDSVRFDGWITDIGASLDMAKNRMTGKNLAAMVLISDGQYNLGGNPVSFAEFSDVPVHTVGIGDVYEQRDIAIEQALSNSVVFVGSRIPVDVSFSSAGYKGRSITVQIRRNGRVLDSKSVTAPDDISFSTLRFEISADEEGMQKYEAAVVPLSGEMTAGNNVKAFYVQVLKNRVKVLLISGQPGPDQSMIYQSVISNPDYQLKALIQKPDGTFITMTDDTSLPESIGEYDCYIFNQYPTVRSNSAYFTQLSEHILDSQKPWLFLYGPGVDLKRYQALKGAGGADFAPDPNIRETQVSLKLTAQGRSHSVIQINESIETTDRFWADLPPVWIQKAVILPPPESSVLVRADMSKAPQVLKLHGDIPLIISHRQKKQKSMTVAFYGLWKTHFTPLGLGKQNPVFEAFIGQTIRWLTLTDDARQVSVQTSKPVYQSGEKIMITGQAYDDQYKPVNDAAFRVSIRSKEVQAALQLNPAGNGRYEAVTGALPVGDYVIDGEAERSGTSLGRDNRKFSVEVYSAELIRTSQNQDLLRRMAGLSGGRYLTPDQPEELRKILNYEPEILEKKTETDLWNKPWMLFFISALLAAEWWIRKRSDML